MKYASGGDLHNYLQKNFTTITWKEKFLILLDIFRGLKTIHNANFVHRDFHSGNILFDENISWKIGDLGLSQPVNDTSNNEIYGVIPYIAPEIFKGFAFSKESDVYSMGMIMWELTTGCKPFANVEHDIHLILKILDGERPKITEDTPECYANLMISCWDPDPKKRPSIKEIYHKFDYWVKYYINLELARNYYGIREVPEWWWMFSDGIGEHFDRAERNRKELINSRKFGPEFSEKPHSKAIYTSRPLSSLISKCSSINSSIISFDNKQDYTSRELDLDIDIESLPLPTLNPIIQNSSTILHSNAIYTDEHLNVLPTSLKKRNIEESNIETHDNKNALKLVRVPSHKG
ncbi:kinase-like domain-containing protein [Glomus cerebriforme]|uniref:Kinase-like domain-containing protein n=1 Tax=Glomus cerebriforme TaxID=658196 RepID=A0A397T021_9GLOM|nr:kinase-like domain-containing protein [Glomus cerebriforme]